MVSQLQSIYIASPRMGGATQGNIVPLKAQARPGNFLDLYYNLLCTHIEIPAQTIAIPIHVPNQTPSSAPSYVGYTNKKSTAIASEKESTHTSLDTFALRQILTKDGKQESQGVYYGHSQAQFQQWFQLQLFQSQPGRELENIPACPISRKNQTEPVRFITMSYRMVKLVSQCLQSLEGMRWTCNSQSGTAQLGLLKRSKTAYIALSRSISQFCTLSSTSTLDSNSLQNNPFDCPN